MTTDKLTDAEKDAIIVAVAPVGFLDLDEFHLRAIFDAGVKHGMERERERIVALILGGRFLHDDAPAKRFAEEVVAAIHREIPNV